MRLKINKSMKWNWFKAPVEVKQISEYLILFSDTEQSQYNQKVTVMIDDL